MKALFQKLRTRMSHRPRVRRSRQSRRPGIEHLERRLALSAAPAWVQNILSLAETETVRFAADMVANPSTFETKASALVGDSEAWSVFTSIPDGVKIEKWVEAKAPAWVNVSAFPA